MSDDLNLVVIAGRLAAPPERNEYVDSGGSRMLRVLITVRSEAPIRRVDVIPVVMWDPPDQIWDAELDPGMRLWVAGATQRRFWSGPDGRRSRLEVVAEQICLREGPVHKPAARMVTCSCGCGATKPDDGLCECGSPLGHA